MNKRTYNLIKKSVLAVGGFAIVLTLAMGIINKNNSAKASTYNVKYFKCITIDENDSLWTIAEENITEEYDTIGDYIKEVKSINNLDNDKIYSGASLVVPYYAAPQ